VSFRETVAASEIPLTATEHRVLETLLADPVNMAFLSAREVAELADVHESTVVRLGQKLGFAKYAQVRQSLRTDAAKLEGLTREGARNAKAFELRSLVDDEIEALRRLPLSVPQTAIDLTAKDALTARQIYIAGNAHAEIPVSLLQLRLRRLGMTAIALDPEPKSIVEWLSTSTADDMIIVFALRTKPTWLSAVLAHAHRIGAKSLVITDILSDTFRPAPTHILAAPRGPDPDFRTVIVPAVICYALQLAIYHADPQRADAAQRSTQELRTAMGNPAPQLSERMGMNRINDKESTE